MAWQREKALKRMERMVSSTLAQGGFHMPAEWEKHEATWLQWPHDDTISGHQMRLEHRWLAMIEALHEHETVYILGS